MTKSEAINLEFKKARNSNLSDNACYELVKALELFQDFYDVDDMEHGFNHVTDVYIRAIKMSGALNIEYRKLNIIALAAVGHDIFSRKDRTNHHELGYNYIKEHGSEYGLNEHEVEKVARAVKEHRASYTGEYYSGLSQLISAADRDAPDITSVIKRVYGCAIDPELEFEIDKGKPIPNIMVRNSYIEEIEIPLPVSAKIYLSRGYSWDIVKTYVHIVEKYGRHGYARYNDVYTQFYKKELESFFKAIDMLDPIGVKLLVKPDKEYSEKEMLTSLDNGETIPGVINSFPSFKGGYLVLARRIPFGLSATRQFMLINTLTCACGSDINIVKKCGGSLFSNVTEDPNNVLLNHPTPENMVCKNCGLQLPVSKRSMIRDQKEFDFMYLYHIYKK